MAIGLAQLLRLLFCILCARQKLCTTYTAVQPRQRQHETRAIATAPAVQCVCQPSWPRTVTSRIQRAHAPALLACDAFKSLRSLFSSGFIRRSMATACSRVKRLGVPAPRAGEPSPAPRGVDGAAGAAAVAAAAPLSVPPPPPSACVCKAKGVPTGIGLDRQYGSGRRRWHARRWHFTLPSQRPHHSIRGSQPRPSSL